MDIHLVHTFSVGQATMHMLICVHKLNIELLGGVPSSPDNQVCVEQHTLTLFFSDNLVWDLLDLLLLSGMSYPYRIVFLIILNCKGFLQGACLILLDSHQISLPGLSFKEKKD